MNNILGKIRNVFLSISTLFFLLSVLAYYLPANSWSFIAPFSFLFLPLFFIQAMILMAFSHSPQSFKLTNLIIYLLSIPLIFNTIGFHVPFWDKKEGGVKVVSWNIKNFDVYNWSKEKNTKENIIETIRRQNGDIVCLQEFYSSKDDWDMMKKMKNIGYPYFYFKELYSNGDKNSNQWGLAIFSKYPIGKTKKLDFQEYGGLLNQCIAAKINTPIGVIEVYNAHFQSIHFGYDDYRFLDNIKDNRDSLEPKGALQIFNKIRKAYKNRIGQVKLVKEEIENNPEEKYIICCDLNDIPSSNAYKKISDHLKDAFVEKGFGLSATINIPITIYRIDYIFTSKNLKTINYQRDKTKFSDHSLVTARIN